MHVADKKGVTPPLQTPPPPKKHSYFVESVDILETTPLL